MIDPVTNLCELVRINNRSDEHIAEQFANTWLARYPRPNRCVHDNGNEFKGRTFQVLLEQAGVQNVPTTVKNPQANAIVERLNQTVANILRVYVDTTPPANAQQAEQYIDNALATAMHATRCAVTRALNMTPGALVFHRDMFLDVPIIGNLEAIRQRRQMIVDQDLQRSNAKRRHYDYQVGQHVFIKQWKQGKLLSRAIGPYPILQVHVNGNVTIQRTPQVTERVNIRRIVPFRTN